MIYPYTGIILAGGLGTRLSGRNKAFIKVNGRRIIDNTYAVFKKLFREIILVTNAPELYREWDNLKVVPDIFQARSSMTGLHAGLSHASFPFAFAVACDSPFLKPGLIEAVLSHIRPDTYIVVPQVPKGYEPLCAVYSKNCVPDLETCLNAGRYQILEIFDKGPTIRVPGSRLRAFDPELSSFFNINTPGDLETAGIKSSCDPNRRPAP